MLALEMQPTTHLAALVPHRCQGEGPGRLAPEPAAQGHPRTRGAALGIASHDVSPGKELVLRLRNAPPGTFALPGTFERAFAQPGARIDPQHGQPLVAIESKDREHGSGDIRPRQLGHRGARASR